jgi:hypothetical protein
MIEFTSLEFVLLIGNIVLLFLYYQLSQRVKQQVFAMATLLHGIHTGKLKITETDTQLKVETV